MRHTDRQLVCSYNWFVILMAPVCILIYSQNAAAQVQVLLWDCHIYLHVYEGYHKQNENHWNLQNADTVYAVMLQLLMRCAADAGVGICLYGDWGHVALLDTSTGTWQTAVQVCSQTPSYLPGTVWHGRWICPSSGNSWSVQYLLSFMFLVIRLTQTVDFESLHCDMIRYAIRWKTDGLIAKLAILVSCMTS